MSNRMIKPRFSTLQVIGFLLMGLVFGFLLGIHAYPFVVAA